MSSRPAPHAKPRFASRRDFLFRSGQGIGGLALASLLDQDGLLAAGCENVTGIKSPFSPKQPHFKPRARM